MKDLLYWIKNTTMMIFMEIVLAGRSKQSSVILPAQVANHSAGYV